MYFEPKLVTLLKSASNHFYTYIKVFFELTRFLPFSLCLSVCLSVFLSVCLSVLLAGWLSLSLSVGKSPLE